MATAKQLAAQKLFAKRSKAGTLKKTVRRKNPVDVYDLSTRKGMIKALNKLGYKAADHKIEPKMQDKGEVMVTLPALPYSLKVVLSLNRGYWKIDPIDTDTPDSVGQHEALRDFKTQFVCLIEHAEPKHNPVPAVTNKAASMIDVRKAANLFERFTGHDADSAFRVNIPALPKVAAVIGELDGVLYSTVRDGVLEKYIHKFAKNDKPLFAVSPDGRCMVIIGGRYQFTERGIVDKSDKSR